jgi:hypothetical protein
MKRYTHIIWTPFPSSATKMSLGTTVGKKFLPKPGRGGVMGGSPNWKVQIKIGFTLPGTNFGGSGDHMRVYLNALYAPGARLHN